MSRRETRPGLVAWILGDGGREIALRAPEPADVLMEDDGPVIFEAVVEGRLRLVIALADENVGRTFRLASPAPAIVEAMAESSLSVRDAMRCGTISFALRRDDGSTRLRDASGDETPEGEWLPDAAVFLDGSLPRKASLAGAEGVAAFSRAWAHAVTSTFGRRGLSAEGAHIGPENVIAFRILEGPSCLSRIIFSLEDDGWWNAKITMKDE